jgi:hypothetical protein
MFVLQDKDNILDSRLVASGQFSNLNSICYIQISHLNFLQLHPNFFNLTTVLPINVAYMIRKKKAYYNIMLIIQFKKLPNLILT